jgi:NADPH:quinone reductase-like Zn-dependent oxidoreductase
VFGFVPPLNPVVQNGAWAELIAVPESCAIRKPERIDRTIAGAAPLAAIMAITAIDALGLSGSDVVLIAGATGGVGSFAVQLAAAAGATVIAPALPADEAYLRSLGASQLVSRDHDIVAQVRELHPSGVDALLDNVSRRPGTYDAALKDRARVASPNGAAGHGPGRTNLRAIPSRENLGRLGQLLEAGTLRVPIHHAYPLEQAARAMKELATGHTQGKIALHV